MGESYRALVLLLEAGFCAKSMTTARARRSLINRDQTTPKPSGGISYWRKKSWTKDRVVGSAKQIKGAVKQVVGKAIGDAKLESEGRADKVEGKVQNAIGGLKDKLKGK